MLVSRDTWIPLSYHVAGAPNSHCGLILSLSFSSHPAYQTRNNHKEPALFHTMKSPPGGSVGTEYKYQIPRQNNASRPKSVSISLHLPYSNLRYLIQLRRHDHPKPTHIPSHLPIPSLSERHPPSTHSHSQPQPNLNPLPLSPSSPPQQDPPTKANPPWRPHHNGLHLRRTPPAHPPLRRAALRRHPPSHGESAR